VPRLGVFCSPLRAISRSAPAGLFCVFFCGFFRRTGVRSFFTCSLSSCLLLKHCFPAGHFVFEQAGPFFFFLPFFLLPISLSFRSANPSCLPPPSTLSFRGFAASRRTRKPGPGLFPLFFLTHPPIYTPFIFSQRSIFCSSATWRLSFNLSHVFPVRMSPFFPTPPVSFFLSKRHKLAKAVLTVLHGRPSFFFLSPGCIRQCPQTRKWSPISSSQSNFTQCDHLLGLRSFFRNHLGGYSRSLTECRTFCVFFFTNLEVFSPLCFTFSQSFGMLSVSFHLLALGGNLLFFFLGGLGNL